MTLPADAIRIEELELLARIGVTAEERAEPQRVVLCATLRPRRSFAEMSDDLRRLLAGKILSTASRDRLEKWMAGNQTGDATIRAGIPKNWRVGDKTGRGERNATNDIAILHPPTGGPIFLAIYSVGSKASLQQRQGAIAEVAKLVAEILRPNDALHTAPSKEKRAQQDSNLRPTD